MCRVFLVCVIAECSSLFVFFLEVMSVKKGRESSSAYFPIVMPNGTVEFGEILVTRSALKDHAYRRLSDTVSADKDGDESSMYLDAVLFENTETVAATISAASIRGVAPSSSPLFVSVISPVKFRGASCGCAIVCALFNIPIICTGYFSSLEQLAPTYTLHAVDNVRVKASATSSMNQQLWVPRGNLKDVSGLPLYSLEEFFEGRKPRPGDVIVVNSISDILLMARSFASPTV